MEIKVKASFNQSDRDYYMINLHKLDDNHIQNNLEMKLIAYESEQKKK